MPSSDGGSRESSPAAPSGGGRRKSGRAKKQIERLDPSSSKAKAAKRKRGAASDDDDEPTASEDDGDDFQSADDSDEEEYRAPKAAPSARKKVPNGSSARKPRASAGAGKGRKPRARKAADEDGEDDAAPKTGAAGKASAKDFKIEGDNGLFNAVKNPNTALQQTAEDWIEQYKEESGPAMAELVNFVLRCCGCNAAIDEHQAEDENGIVENLKDIVDEFKQESNHAYPLISKSKPYKKFRASLSQFLSKLLTLAADDVLFETSFYEHFSAWVHALSSSQIRALRHTATVIVLLTVNALSELHVAVKKEHSQALRAKEAEEKKERKDKGRLRDMERQVKEVHERLEQIEAFIDEGYTSVFVNRYRDADAVIRAECINALGHWMKLDPDMWIDGDYLRYIGWVLSDESKEARRESVRALFSLYQKDTHIGKLHHFTDRFKQTLVDMAVGEHDINVRIQAIHVVRQIDGHGLLTDKQRDEVAQLVFEREKRVRTAAAEFWKGLVDEEVETKQGELEAQGTTGKGRKKGGRKDKEQERERDAQIQFKVLADLLTRYGKELDGGIGGADEDVDEDSQDRRDKAVAEDLSLPLPNGDAEDPTAAVPHGRVALAVEALWDGVDVLRDWQALLSYLLKDHSSAVEGSPAAAGPSSAKKGKGRGKKAAAAEEEADEEADEEQEGESLPQPLKLEEEEETLMVEVLVACLTKVVGASRGSSSKKDKEQDDEDLAALSRAVIDALPKLFAKHQTFPGRMVDVLAIPRLVNLELYLDMRQVTAYESLWDDVNKQFLKHTSPVVLDQAALTLIHFLSVSNLSATNTTKLAELEDSLITSLRTTTADRDVESATFEDDEVHALTACVARLEKLAKVRNLGNALEENHAGKETSAAELLDQIVNRGRLGYKEEATLIEHAVNILCTHLVWHLQSVAVETRQAGQAELGAVLNVKDKRQQLLDKLEEFAVGNETNAAEPVKQVALAFLLDIYTISRQLTSPVYDPDGHLSELKLSASDELQARIAGYVEAEMERYAEQLAEADAEEEEEDEEEQSEDERSGSETETEESLRRASQKSKKGKGKKAAKGKGKKAAKKQDKRRRKSAAQIRAENIKQQAKLVAAQRFEQILAPFVRAIHSGTVDLRHAVVLLKYWGRLGAVFDEQAKLLMHDLRDEGNYGSAGEAVASILVEVLKGACDLLIDAPESSAASEEQLVSLGRHLVQVVVVRGAQLAVVAQLPAEDHLRLHLDALKYAVSKLAHFEETKRREERGKILAFFKALGHLLLGLDGRSALKVKTALDAMLDENKLELSATSKTWEPIRAYQRRLVTAMSKDPTIQKAASAKKTKAKSKARGKKKASDEDDDEDELDQNGDDDDDLGSPAPGASSPAASRARPRRGAAAIAQELGVEPQSPAVASSATRGSKRGAAPAETQESDTSAGADVEQSSPRKKQRRAEPVEEEQEDERDSPAGASDAEDAQPHYDSGDIGTTMTQSVSASQKKRRRGEEELEEGDLGSTQAESAPRADDEQETRAEDEREREAFEREGSADSAASLTDLKKKKKKRARR
ncbi:hypothetical protein JCM8097_003715 [Rhodosporidiobolus ruineniae]